MKALFLIPLLLVGCSHTRIVKTSTTGENFEASNTRWLWNTEGLDADLGPSGLKVKLQKSNPDVEALKAVAEGVAKGAVQGVK